MISILQYFAEIDLEGSGPVADTAIDQEGSDVTVL